MNVSWILIGFIYLNIDLHYARELVNLGSLPQRTSNTTGELPIQCPNGFIRYDDYCYSFYPQHLSWIEAIMFCKMYDLDLAHLYTEEQYKFLKFHLKSISANSNGLFRAAGFWLSATDSYSPGHWIWIKDKSDVEFSNWGGTIRSSSSGGCLGLSRSNSFSEASLPCGQSALHPICEIKTSMLV